MWSVAQKKNRTTRRMTIEPLEHRTLMAVTCSVTPEKALLIDSSAIVDSQRAIIAGQPADLGFATGCGFRARATGGCAAG